MSDSDDDCPALVSAASPITTPLPPSTSAQQQPEILDDDTLRSIPTVPLVILSGFLGSGKTTLIQYVLSAQHGMRIAVIVNEFEFGRSIEKGLTVRSAEASDDEWVELRNGCMCCSAKSQSVQALEQLVTKRRGELDAILIETAGLADPIPIARSFWLDEALQAKVKLAGIVAVVDSSNIERYIKSERFVEAARQLLSADRIIMNKVDVVGSPITFMDCQDEIQRTIWESPKASPPTLKSDDAAEEQPQPPTPAALRRAADTVREVNPVAPIIMTSLRSLLLDGDSNDHDDGDKKNSSDQPKRKKPPTVPIHKLKRLLLLDDSGDDDGSVVGDQDGSSSRAGSTEAAVRQQQQQHQPKELKWLKETSQHTHTSGLCSTEIEVEQRVFTSLRDVDYFFASILDNSVDGQDENNEQIPAQIAAQERGAVVVRSKSAVWVRTSSGSGASKNDAADDRADGTTTTHKNSKESNCSANIMACQVQSIGSTFEVVPMAGLNAMTEKQREDILPPGTNRLLLLGFSLKADELRRAFIAKTSPLC